MSDDYKPKHENLTPSQQRKIEKRDSEEKAKQERATRRKRGAHYRAKRDKARAAYHLQKEKARRMDLETLNRGLARAPIETPEPPKITGPRLAPTPPPVKPETPPAAAVGALRKKATTIIRRTKAGKVLNVIKKVLD
jgi:hypothetical protein